MEQPGEKRYLSKKEFWIFISIALALGTAISLILFSLGLYSLSDESDRTLLAYYWLIGKMPVGETWLPLHTVINGLALHFYFDLFATPRIVGFIFGLLSLLSVVWFSAQVFRNRIITLITVLFAGLFPPFAVIRTLPLTESMYIFFVVAGITFYFKWVDKEKSYQLIFSAIMFSLSALVRYEGWIFSFCFFVCVIFQHSKAGKQLIVLIIIILVAFPLFWLHKSLVETGSPFTLLFASGNRYRMIEKNLFFSISKHNMLTQFIIQNIIYLNFGGIISLFGLVIINERIRKWVALPAGTFVIMALLSFAAIALPTNTVWRIPLPWSVLLIPFTAHFLVKLSELLHDMYKIHKTKFWTTISAVVVIYFSFQLYRISTTSELDKTKLNTGKLIREIKKSDNGNWKILIDTYSWDYVNILMASDNPEIFIFNSGKDSKFPTKPIIDLNGNIDYAHLAKLKIKYAMFNREDYKKFLTGEKGIKPVRSFGKWELFRIMCN